MATSLVRLGVRGPRQVLISELLGLRAATLTTKATNPKKRKQAKDDRAVVAPVDGAGLLTNKTPVQCADHLSSAVSYTGAEAGEVSSSDSHIHAAEITNAKRASLISKKTLLFFPGRVPGPTPLPPAEKRQGEAVRSAAGIPEHGERSVDPSRASGEPGGEKSAAEEDSSSDSSSSSSSGSDSDSDEETVTDDAVKTRVEFPRRDSVHCTQARVADRTRASKEVERGGLVIEPQAEQQAAKAPASRDSAAESPTELSKTAEGKEAEAACLETTARGDPKGVKAAPRGDHHAGAKATVTAPGASSLPKAKSVTKETAASSLPKASVLPAQGETRELESAEETTPESPTPALAEAPGTPQELVEEQEPIEEVLDSSTYKNTQHHDYNPLTFVDLDMEMAKYRLPQPSSGRMSPRH